MHTSSLIEAFEKQQKGFNDTMQYTYIKTGELTGFQFHPTSYFCRINTSWHNKSNKEQKVQYSVNIRRSLVHVQRFFKQAVSFVNKGLCGVGRRMAEFPGFNRPFRVPRQSMNGFVMSQICKIKHFCLV